MEKKFQELLINLKKLGAEGFKLELESEFLSKDFCEKIINLLKEIELETILKLGGFSSTNDLYLAKKLKIRKIVAPMIESVYSLEKFTKTSCKIFEDEINEKELFINIETKNAVKNFDEIINSPYIKNISGIILGRKDLAQSFGFDCNFINSKEMFETIRPVFKECSKMNKKFIIGGEISIQSVDFIEEFNELNPFGFETRKIFFNRNKTKNIKEAITKAIELEIFYIENLAEKTPLAKNRVEILKNRIKNYNPAFAITE